MFYIVPDNGVLLRLIVVGSSRRSRSRCLAWSVEDIAATVAAFTARGVAFERFTGVEQDDLGVWRSPGGAQVARFKEPDGNTLSPTQF